MGPVKTKINHVITSSEGPSNKFHQNIRISSMGSAVKHKNWIDQPVCIHLMHFTGYMKIW